MSCLPPTIKRNGVWARGRINRAQGVWRPCPLAAPALRLSMPGLCSPRSGDSTASAHHDIRMTKTWELVAESSFPECFPLRLLIHLRRLPGAKPYASQRSVRRRVPDEGEGLSGRGNGARGARLFTGHIPRSTYCSPWCSAIWDAVLHRCLVVFSLATFSCIAFDPSPTNSNSRSARSQLCASSTTHRPVYPPV